MSRIPWPQFSLRGLLLAVVFAAYACGALWSATDLWASATWTLTLAMLAFAMLAAWLRHGRQRAFWLGFLLFGLGYLTLSHGPWFDGNVRHRLLSDKLLTWAFSLTPAGESNALVISGATFAMGQPPQGQLVVASGNGSTWSTNTVYGSAGTVLWNPATGAPVAGGPTAWEPFQQTGHSLFALLLALLGACIARRLWADGNNAVSGPV
jgi:uncharacterized membrane protein YqaE (UPF0057 family)